MNGLCKNGFRKNLHMKTIKENGFDFNGWWIIKYHKMLDINEFVNFFFHFFEIISF